MFGIANAYSSEVGPIITKVNIGVPISVLIMFVIALLAVIVVLIKRMKKTH